MGKFIFKEGLLRKLIFVGILLISYFFFTIHGVIALVFSFILHEIGHYTVLRRYGFDASNLDLGLTILKIDSNKGLTPKQDIIFCLMGPVLGLGSLFISYPYLTMVVEDIVLINEIVFVVCFTQLFNLLPLEGYDGYYIMKGINRMYR